MPLFVPTVKEIKHTWWKEASVFQIYPSSFKDSNGDGWGDLGGIIEKLDYIKKLGVDLVWCSPINKSPMVDMGYDISDYKDIDPMYGDLATFDKMIAEMKKRDIGFILDLVVNHTSSQHPWFLESRSSLDNPKRDWYIWKKPKYDANGNRQPPNNWSSHFKPSAWTWDEKTGEYYLSLFADEQPDLNWENADVRVAVHDIVTFWLERGVKGFRLDVINFISKAPGLPDAKVTNPNSEYQSGHEYYANGPRLNEYLAGLGKIFKKYDAFTVGEMPHIKDVYEILNVVGQDRDELSTIFQFDYVELNQDKGRYDLKPLDLNFVKDLMEKYQKELPELGGWNATFIENHDQSRAISRYLNDSPEFRAKASKMIATFINFQVGTPFVYQGQELGMINIPKSWPVEEYIDIESTHYYKEFLKTHPNATEEDKKGFVKLLQVNSRDSARTPFHWDTTENAGFCKAGVKPWMSVTPDYKEGVNAEQELADPNSAFHYWAKALRVRKEQKSTAVYGFFDLVAKDVDNVISFTRTNGEEKILVVLNWADKRVPYKAPLRGEIILNSYDTLDEEFLEPYQAYVAKI